VISKELFFPSRISMSKNLSFLCLVAEVGHTKPSANLLLTQASGKLVQKQGLAEANYTDCSEVTRK